MRYSIDNEKLYKVLSTILFVIITFPFPIIYLVWEYSYFKKEKFQNIKSNIKKYIDDCNELNNHIEELRRPFNNFKTRDYGTATFVDNSNYNYKRDHLNKYQKNQFTYNCSLQVCRNAQEKPFVYLCKYFNISNTEESLNNFEEMLNNFSSAEQGKILLKNKKEDVLKNIYEQIPFIIKTFRKKKLEEKLGFTPIEFKSLYFPTYTFSYISSGGNTSTSTRITLDIDALNRFIEYLSENIKWRKSIAGQRALMTSSLREKIKNRDNFTCQICNNSINDEPNLLLEIDHKIPLSKGGITTEDNLQTLCWRCNRKKGNKIQ